MCNLIMPTNKSSDTNHFNSPISTHMTLTGQSNSNSILSSAPTASHTGLSPPQPVASKPTEPQRLPKEDEQPTLKAQPFSFQSNPAPVKSASPKPAVPQLPEAILTPSATTTTTTRPITPPTPSSSPSPSSPPPTHSAPPANNFPQPNNKNRSTQHQLTVAQLLSQTRQKKSATTNDQPVAKTTTTTTPSEMPSPFPGVRDR